MARAWDPDVEIDERFVRLRLARQFPEFVDSLITPIGVGFDNAAFLVDGRIVFRFPRRSFAVKFMRHETRILPMLGPQLPLPVPSPTYVGIPDEEYPYPFSGYPFLPGSTACRVSWTNDQRALAAPTLGRFLKDLHSVPVSVETRAWAPADEIRRTDLVYRLADVRRRLDSVPEAAAVLASLESLASTPAAQQTAWVHGDFYPRHLLVDQNLRLSAIIDWGDVHLGDPSLDLSIAFTFVPHGARPAFRDAYGPIDDATWDRARFRALYYGVVLSEYGRDVGDEGMLRAGQDAVRFATF